MKNKLSIYGGTGFIGGRFCELYPDKIVKIERNSPIPQSNNIVYLISTTNNYNVFSQPYLDIDTNLTTLVKTLEACRKYSKDIVFNFISSWFVYGKTNYLPAKEDDNYCNPKGFYSITKRAAEQLLISYCETYSLKYRIMRLCNVCGESDLKFSKKKNALQYLINEVINNRDVNLYDGGTNIRDYMYVNDVCAAIKTCVETSPTNEIINIGSGKPHQIKDMLEYVRNKVESKSKFISIESPEFHKVVQIKDMYLDVTKLKNLGYVRNYDMTEMLDIIIKNTRENK